MNKKVLAMSLVICMGAASISGCGKKDETIEETSSITDMVGDSYTVTLEDSATLNEDVDSILLTKDGMVQSDLTGEWVTPEQNEKRPVAIMVNNIIDSMPQSGVEKADVIFEFLEEGGITRLMPIYSDWSGLDKIGSCRSARYYYDRKAVEFDAIFIHFGYNYLAEADFESYNYLDHIDGNSTDNAYFYRSSDRVAPHNAYTSSDGIDKCIAAHEFQTTHKDYYQKTFNFNMEDTVPEGGSPATKITTAFNEGRKPWFEYDEESGKYLRWQYGTQQIDDTTGNQLAFENVIIQFCKHDVVPGEESTDLQDIWLTGEGEGWYASDGVIVPITWYKAGSADCTHYYTLDGEDLKMNPGKTWVTIFKDSNKDGIIVENTSSSSSDSSDSSDD